MAAGPITQLADMIVPEIFAARVQQETALKSNLIRSGMVVPSEMLDGFLLGGGLTYKIPSQRDLDDDQENVSTDDVADIVALSASGGTPAFPGSFNDAIPAKVGSDLEIGVRLSRNMGWSRAALTAALTGQDPLAGIINRASNYRVGRLQAAFIATWQGVCKDNALNDNSDYAVDIAGASYSAGVTDFSGAAAIDAQLTAGDSQDEFVGMAVHSVVYARMKKNDLIEFMRDSDGRRTIPTYQGKVVIQDDKLPSGTSVVRGDGSAGEAGVYETWFFGTESTLLGQGVPLGEPAAEVERNAAAGNGAGQSTLWNRWEWMIHPVGHAFVAAAPADGGPSNDATVNNLNVATSWDRRRPQRKQIPFARLITREA